MVWVCPGPSRLFEACPPDKRSGVRWRFRTWAGYKPEEPPIKPQSTQARGFPYSFPSSPLFPCKNPQTHGSDAAHGCAGSTSRKPAVRSAGLRPYSRSSARTGRTAGERRQEPAGVMVTAGRAHGDLLRIRGKHELLKDLSALLALEFVNRHLERSLKGDFSLIHRIRFQARISRELNFHLLPRSGLKPARTVF